MWAVFGSVIENQFVRKCGSDGCLPLKRNQLLGLIEQCRIYRERHNKVWPKDSGNYVQFHYVKNIRDIDDDPSGKYYFVGESDE